MAKVKPTSKTCKHCATEIPYEAKVCPNCRKKVKGGKLKWIIIIVILLGLFIAIAGSGGDKDSQSTNTSQDTTSQETVSEATTATSEATTEAKIEYKKYDCTELFDDLKGNALKAEKLHQDEYVKIKGYLGTIDSDGKYIGVGAGEENYDYMFDEIHCYIKSDDQLDKIMEMSKGDEITIKGKITSIGEVLGYSVDIIEIK